MSVPDRAVAVAGEAIMSSAAGAGVDLDERFAYHLAHQAVAAVLDDDLATDAIAGQIEEGRRNAAELAARAR